MNKQLIIYIIIALLIGGAVGYFVAPTAKSESHEHADMASESSEETIWTCSMHPQIRQNEPGLCPICEMELIPLEENRSDDPLELEMTREAVKLSNIQTTTVGTGNKSSPSLTLEGKIQADERLTVSQTAHVPGRIEQLFVTFTGERVTRGQRLARIYSPPLITAQREYLEAKKFGEVSPGLLGAARQKLERWKVPDEWINKLDESGEIQETVTVYAEASGIVTKRFVAVGDYVSEGSPLFGLVNLSRVWVIFDAYESDLVNIDEGDEITFEVRALPGETFTARINYIDPVIDPESRTADVRATVQNRGNRLKPEMFVEGKLTPDRSKGENMLLVPKSAVLWTGPRSVVYLKLPDRDIPTYEYREVVLGDRMGDKYQILSGLSEGDEVVTNGAFVVDAAAQLNNQRSMMNRHVTIEGTEQKDHPDYHDAGNAAFHRGIDKVIDAYLKMKDALVQTDSTGAGQHARAMRNALEMTESGSLEGPADIYWAESTDMILDHLNNLIKADDIEKRRDQFAFVSDQFIELVRVFGTGEENLYMQHCPMAMDDNGANWLSTEEEIRNPYFGDKMLKCGIVKDTIMRME